MIPGMRGGSITEEMRRAFAEAERIRIGDTPLARPALRPDADSLRAHFASEVARARRPLPNPHVEPRVTAAERARAVPAAVLLAVVAHANGPTLIVTRRHERISFAGHWVFPGGRCDPDDATAVDAALREAEEEIGLDPARVEVLGCLGDYVSHSGFRIAPVVALVAPPVALSPHPDEVEAIAELPLARALDPANWFLYRLPGRPGRAHFALDGGDGDVMLTGATASLAIGLYAQLLATHAPV